MNKLNVIPLGWLWKLSDKVRHWSYGDYNYFQWLIKKGPSKYETDICPVCGERLYGYEDYDSDIHMVVESSFACPNRHYYNSFAYGGSEVHVGKYTFYAHYSYNHDQMKEYHNDINVEVGRLQNKWYHTWFTISECVMLIWSSVVFKIKHR